MGRSAKSRKAVTEASAGLFRRCVAALGAAIVRNPVLVGGATAFLVAIFYISANALWYQPHFHAGAFFSTRDIPYTAPPARDGPAGRPGETIIHIEREDSAAIPIPAAPPASTEDSVVKRTQAVLRDLDFYDGAVDGLMGPNTRKAIETYRKTLGLPVNGEIDQQLIDHLGLTTAPAGVPQSQTAAAGASQSQTAAAGNPLIVRIQTGLKEFGNDGIELDGVAGARTRSAIREFQSLFGLPVTGEPDQALYDKMQEIGLTN